MPITRAGYTWLLHVMWRRWNWLWTENRFKQHRITAKLVTVKVER